MFEAGFPCDEKLVMRFLKKGYAVFASITAGSSATAATPSIPATSTMRILPASAAGWITSTITARETQLVRMGSGRAVCRPLAQRAARSHRCGCRGTENGRRDLVGRSRPMRPSTASSPSARRDGSLTATSKNSPNRGAASSRKSATALSRGWIRRAMLRTSNAPS